MRDMKEIQFKRTTIKLLGFLFVVLSLLIKFPIYAAEKEVFLFFSVNHLLIEKDDKLEVIPSRLVLENNYDSFSLLNKEQACEEVFSFSNGHLSVKDPGLKLKTYTECKILLINSKNNIKDEYIFKLNRTFTSWCLLKNRSSQEIQKTINAVLDVVQVKECSDFALKQTLFNAKMLNLAGRQISDLSPLSGLINLRALWLDNNKISKISPIASLNSLIVLSLSNNLVENIDSLNSFKELQWLFLSSNKIKSVDKLSKLTKIKVLSIKDNLILNPEPLFRFQNNTIILPHGNPFIKEACNKSNNLDDKNVTKQLNWLEKVCKVQLQKKNVHYLNSSTTTYEK